MAGDIVRAVLKVQALAAALDGMRAAPDYPEEQMNVFPFAVSYLSLVEVERPSATLASPSLYTIHTEIHVARKDAPRDMETITPYAASFPAAIKAAGQLVDATGATVDAVLSCIGQYLPSDWGGIETRSWQFDTRVKVL